MDAEPEADTSVHILLCVAAPICFTIISTLLRSRICANRKITIHAPGPGNQTAERQRFRIVASSRADVLLKDVQIVILGAAEESVVRDYAKAVNRYATKGVKVLLLRPGHTRIFVQCAPNIPVKDVTWLSRLALNIAEKQVAHRANFEYNRIRNIIVWGHTDLYPDVDAASVYSALDLHPLRKFVKDDDWLAGEFITVVRNVAAAIGTDYRIGPLTLAKAICDHLDDWLVCTRKDQWVSMGVVSDGSYGIPEGEPYSFPVTCTNQEWSIVQGFNMPCTSGGEAVIADDHGLTATISTAANGLKRGKIWHNGLPEEVLEMIFLLLPVAALRKCCVLSRTWKAWLSSRSFWDAWRKKNANTTLHGHWMVSTQLSGVDCYCDGNPIYLSSWVVGLHTGSGTWHKLPDKLLAGRDAGFLAAGDGLVVSCGPENRPVVFNPCTMWYEVLPHPDDEGRRLGVGMLGRGRGIVLLSDITSVYEAASKEWHCGPETPFQVRATNLCCFEDQVWALADETLWEFDTFNLSWMSFEGAELTGPERSQFDHGQLSVDLGRHLFTDGVSLMMVGGVLGTKDVVVCKLVLGSEIKWELVAKLDGHTFDAYLDSHIPKKQSVNINFFGQGDVVHALTRSSSMIPNPPMLWWNFRTGECGHSDVCTFQATSDSRWVPLPVVFEPRFDAKF